MSTDTRNTPMKKMFDLIADHDYWRLLSQQKHALTLTLNLITQGLKHTEDGKDIITAVNRINRVINTDSQVKAILVNALLLSDLYDKVSKMAADAMRSDIDHALDIKGPLKGMTISEASAKFVDEVTKMVAISNEIADLAVDLYSDIKP